MIALLEPVAGETLAAGKRAFQRFFAQQALGERLRQCKLSQPALPDDQQSVRQPATLRLKMTPSDLVK
jgi:hypothetical protein